MTFDERCPYCGSKDIFFKDSRLDYVNGILIETNFCTCKNCKKYFNIVADYVPRIRRYYNPSTCDLLKGEELQDE